MLSVSVYILVDTFFVSHFLGADGLTALNISIPFYSFIASVGMMLAIGGSVLFNFHKNTGKDTVTVFSTTVISALALSLILIFIAVFFSENIAYALGARGYILEMSNVYIKYIMIFSPGFILNQIFSLYIRNDGYPGLTMFATILGSLSNILMDYVLMGPFNMGMKGAIIATCISPIISVIIMLPLVLKSPSLSLKLRFSFEYLKDIINKGISTFLIEISTGLILVIYNLLMLSLEGDIGVAAFAIIANILVVINATFNGLAQGVQPLFSKYYIMKDLDSLRQTLKISIYTILISASLIYGVMALNAQNISAIFNKDNIDLLAEIAILGIRVYFIGIFFQGINIVMSMFFISTSTTKPAHIMAFLKSFVVLGPLAFILTRYLHTMGLWISYPILEFLVMLIGIYMYSIEKKHFKL